MIIRHYEVLPIVIARSVSDEAIRNYELDRNFNVWIAADYVSSAVRSTASSVTVRAEDYALTHLATPKQRTVLFGEMCCSSSQ